MYFQNIAKKLGMLTNFNILVADLYFLAPHGVV